jgi:hypothetical protein
MCESHQGNKGYEGLNSEWGMYYYIGLAILCISNTSREIEDSWRV